MKRRNTIQAVWDRSPFDMSNGRPVIRPGASLLGYVHLYPEQLPKDRPPIKPNRRRSHRARNGRP